MEELELKYQLAELPSAQHRAGLAGLVLMVQYLHRFPEREGAIVELQNPNEFGVTLRMNLEGLRALFNLTYKAFEDVRSTETKIKNYERVESAESTDKKGKTKIVQRYYYKVTVPHGAFLADWDKSSDDDNDGIWVKLWRDMLWQIVRGVPATRNPFNNRVNGAPYSQDAQQVWDELQHPDKTTGQSGNYYLGAMAVNAENVPTKDKARYQFLLHFWVFVAQVYRPAVLDKDGKRELCGYALAIPDVANLHNFCRIFPQVLEARKSDKWGYLPLEAVIDLPEEGALDLLLLLRDRIGYETGDQQLRRLVLGVELIHAEKVGNNIKIRSISQVEPIKKQVDQYRVIKNAYWCPWFRKQRLINLLQDKSEQDEENANLPQGRPWQDFDAVLSRIPRKWLEDPLFSHDARELFTNEAGVSNMKQAIRSYAQIIYQVCQHYVFSKLQSKYDLKWDDCKGNFKKEESYNEKKYKIANEAFLAIRSRTEKQVFIDYFVSTLYPFVRKEEFVNFAEALYQQTDEIRALTLLALSSQFPTTKKSEDKSSDDAAA